MLNHSPLESSTTLILLRPISMPPTSSTHSSSGLTHFRKEMAGPQVTDGQQTLAWATEKLISRTFGDGGTNCSLSPSPNSGVSHLHQAWRENVWGPYPKRTPCPLHLISTAFFPFREDKACVPQLVTEGLKCRSWRSSHSLVKEFPLRC